jgi:hypothetical protein
LGHRGVSSLRGGQAKASSRKGRDRAGAHREGGDRSHERQKVDGGMTPPQVPALSFTTEERFSPLVALISPPRPHAPVHGVRRPSHDQRRTQEPVFLTSGLDLRIVVKGQSTRWARRGSRPTTAGVSQEAGERARRTAALLHVPLTPARPSKALAITARCRRAEGAFGELGAVPGMSGEAKGPRPERGTWSQIGSQDTWHRVSSSPDKGAAPWASSEVQARKVSPT